MYKKTIKYTDFYGNEREEDFYFNLSKSECMKLELTTEGGLIEYAKRLIQAQSGKEIIDTFEKIVMMSYGEKSADGRRFVKGENMELAKAFKETPAYDILFMELLTNDETMAEFFNGVIDVDGPVVTAEEAMKRLNEVDSTK